MDMYILSDGFNIPISIVILKPPITPIMINLLSWSMSFKKVRDVGMGALILNQGT